MQIQKFADHFSFFFVRAAAWRHHSGFGGLPNFRRPLFLHAVLSTRLLLYSRSLQQALKERVLAKFLPVGMPFRRFQADDILQNDGQTRKSERVAVPWMPGNAGGGKDPHFRYAF
jgi:hypothetical protein